MTAIVEGSLGSIERIESPDLEEGAGAFKDLHENKVAAAKLILTT